jgi:hypothetical protein
VVSTRHGKHTKENAIRFVEDIRDRTAGDPPLFLSDAFVCYEDVLLQVYGEDRTPPYKGRGRRPKTRKVFPEGLLYAQVVKQQEQGRLVAWETRVIVGTQEEIVERIRRDGKGSGINTSFIENRNGGYRRENRRLTRKTQCHSKKIRCHEAQIDFSTAHHNFVKPNAGLRTRREDDAPRFERKYNESTPAMAEGITDHVWSLEELLLKRIPKVCHPVVE